MGDDFKVDDVVVRVSDDSGLMPIGSIRRVQSTYWWDGDDEDPADMALIFTSDPPGDSGWFAAGFRKLPKADDSFIRQLRALTPKEDNHA